MRPKITTVGALLGVLLSPAAFAQDGLQLDSDGHSATADLTAARLDAEVSRRGLSVRSTAPGEAWSLTLTTYAVGQKGAIRDMAAARQLRVTADGIEMHRDGFVERHAADGVGADLGWDLDASVFGADGTAWIGLRPSGLLAVVDVDGRGALLVDEAGVARAVLRGVAALDATGRALPARLVQDADGLGISVPGRAAALPIRAEARLDRLAHAAHAAPAAIDGAARDAGAQVGDVDGDGFGDRIALGADGASVEVFRGGPAGFDAAPAWRARLEAPADAVIAAGDLDGDGHGDVAVSSGGAVVVLAGSARGLVERRVARITGEPGAGFGAALAALGDVDGDGYADLAVGAPRAGSGAVFTFRGSAEGIEGAPAATWTSADVDGAARAGFGAALDPEGLDRRGSLLVASWSGSAVCLHAPLGPDAIWPSDASGFEIRTGIDGPVVANALRRVTPGDTMTVEIAATDPLLEGTAGVLLVQYESDPSAALARDRRIDPASPHTQHIPFTASVRGARIALPLPSSTTNGGGSLIMQAGSGPSGGVSATPSTSGNVGVALVPGPVYVSASTGSDTGSGSANDPLLRVTSGIDESEWRWSPQTGYPPVWIAVGTYSDTNVLEEAVSLLGGFDPLTWQPAQNAATVMLANNGGLRFDGITVPTLIKDIEFRSADGPATGAWATANLSRAVRVDDSTEALHFEDCRMIAGDGEDGRNGSTPGVTPAPAFRGFDGQNANLIPYENKAGGIGGFGVAGAGTPSLWGGDGGDGTAITNGNSGGYPHERQVIGSFVVRFAQFCAVPGSGGSVIGTTATKSGDDGSNGPNGADGAGGVTAQFRGIELADGGWRSGRGGDGQTAERGCGGAGGGGGTGFAWSTPFPPFYYQWDGGGGGGGGAGGRPGTHGTGATNGGGSFALFLVDSSPRVIDCVLQAGNGGRGGNGGQGTSGGSGGLGGDGGNFFNGTFGAAGASITVGLGGGGDGGDGGRGGHGGGGAGGHGGPSYCIFAGGNSSAVNIPASSNTMLPGAGGAGGAGGHNAQSGGSGATGIIW